MKNPISLLLLIVLVFSGCGKKKDSKKIEKEPNLASRKTEGLKGRLDEYVFDDSSNVGTFSFVEEDQNASKPKKKDSYLSEEDLAENLIREQVEDEALAFSDYQDGEEDFERVSFPFNKEELTRGQQEKLHKNIELARKAASKNRGIEVRAYGCEMGSADFNMGLSQKRASVIKKEMVAHGIPEKQVSAVGRGQEYQIAWSNATDRDTRIKELAPNRRAEISSAPNS